MKIRQYIVTYRNETILNACLDSIFNNLDDEQLAKLELFIINNHSEFAINPLYANRVTVLHNMVRPDFSAGHLSRNWNQALVNGFQSLAKPACDIVILNQNDVVFKKDYINTLIRLHERYNFIQFGIGDSCMSYTPTAVKRIGLWDERFCNIGYQEFDYFVRAQKYHGEKSSIAKLSGVGIIHNPLNAEDVIVEIVPSGYTRKDLYHMESLQYHKIGEHLLQLKWNHHYAIAEGKIKDIPGIESYITYPYFEQDIETLKEQRYIVPENFLRYDRQPQPT